MPKSVLTSTRTTSEGNFHCYALPKAMLKISLWVMTDDEKPVFEIRPELSIIPDPELRYYLRYSSLGNSHNTIKVGFADEGYLNSIEVVREDKTLEIIENVIQSIKDAATGGGPTDKSIPGAFEPYELFQTTIDPLDQGEIDRVSNIIKKVAPDARLAFSLLGEAKQNTGTDEKPSYNYVFADAPLQGDGFFARAMTSGRLTYEVSGIIKEEIHKVPHPVPHLVKIPFAPFVKNTLKLEFGPYGQPKTIDLDQPSWMEKASQFPGKLLGGMIDLPGRLVRLRVNYDSEMENAKEELKAYKKKKNEEVKNEEIKE
ncbi:MAG: hypothetical protein R3B47_17480 [Bacteroidia bacterium]